MAPRVTEVERDKGDRAPEQDPIPRTAHDIMVEAGKVSLIVSVADNGYGFERRESLRPAAAPDVRAIRAARARSDRVPVGTEQTHSTCEHDGRDTCRLFGSTAGHVSHHT
jgi:hypothetical protein